MHRCVAWVTQQTQRPKDAKDERVPRFLVIYGTIIRSQLPDFCTVTKNPTNPSEIKHKYIREDSKKKALSADPGYY